MHVLESYALQNDLKIDRPFVYEKFFPLAIDKFITIDTSNLGTPALSLRSLAAWWWTLFTRC